jgi:DNA-directed DNA polymerase III PolC
MDDFVHLEVQSAFSFLWGGFTPADLVRRVAELGQAAVALTDDGLYGVVRFCRAAGEAGVRPVIGAKVLLRDGSRLTLLVRDRAGYANLCRLLGENLRESMLQQAYLKLDRLMACGEGLICLAGGWGTPLAEVMAADGPDESRRWLMKLARAFPRPETLFVVLQGQGRPEDVEIQGRLLALAGELGLPVVATAGAVYLNPEDRVVHETLVGIQKNHHHRRIEPLAGDQYYLASGREMAARVLVPEALANTGRIAELCRGFSLPLGRLHPPVLSAPEESARELARVCLKRLARLHCPVPLAYLEQLDRELLCIGRRGMSDFFLLVKDEVEFARRAGIRHSVRGSAAGSLVVYLTLGGVDPVEHGLLFDRFINDGRRDMPDVDLDFDSERRDEVIHHLMDRFPGRTAMVATIQKLKIRSAVRLSARALGYDLLEIKRLSVCLPWSLKGYDLATALEILPELKDTPLRQETRLVEVATRLSRLPFAASVHLGGVIITPDDIHFWTPVGLSPKGFPVGQLDKDDVDILGLLKLDLLGLRMHTALRKAAEILAGQGRPLELENLPLDDSRTYALLQGTESLGVFQVESPGQRALLGRLQPSRFADLVAEISLFRPGPVEGNIVDPFVRRRTGEEPAVYPHPDLRPILEETYGLILFQEQVLRIVHVFAGLSYGEADSFRRVMTKDRYSKDMEMLRQRFVEESVARGRPLDLAEQVFRQVLILAAYGFCKAHAASFAHITYQSAYLKAHYPQAFYLGLLNAGHVGSYPASVILNEARRWGVPIYGPHVNAGGLEYLPEGRGIRVPLVVVNGVGLGLVGRIVGERERGGQYQSREDFLGRVVLPRRLVRTLELAGALDGLERRAGVLFATGTNYG